MSSKATKKADSLKRIKQQNIHPATSISIHMSSKSIKEEDSVIKQAIVVDSTSPSNADPEENSARAYTPTMKEDCSLIKQQDCLSTTSSTDPEGNCEDNNNTSRSDDSVILDNHDTGSVQRTAETVQQSSKEECSEVRKQIITSAFLSTIPGNQKCFDCNIDNPCWTNTSYCIFLCPSCAVIHSEFGLNIKPLSDRDLTVAERALLSRTGNTVAERYWLAMRGKGAKGYLHAHAPKDARTKYIVDKYRGKWLHPDARNMLESTHHAFSAPPAFYYNPPPYDYLVAQTQQLSLGSYGSDVNGGQGEIAGVYGSGMYCSTPISNYSITGYSGVNGYGFDMNNNGTGIYYPQHHHYGHHPGAYNNNYVGYHGSYNDTPTNYPIVNSQGMVVQHQSLNGMSNGTTGTHGTNGKELASTPSFVMNNTAAYSRRGRGKYRPTH